MGSSPVARFGHRADRALDVTRSRMGAHSRTLGVVIEVASAAHLVGKGVHTLP